MVLASAGALRVPSRKGVAVAAAMGAPPAAAVDTCVGAVRAGARRSVPPPTAAVLCCLAAVDARADARVADLPHGAERFKVPVMQWGGALRHKVVLLNLRNYGCIICQHMLRGLAALEAAVGPAAGGAVVRVHSSKYVAKRDAANLRAVAARYVVGYPVVNDAEMVLCGANGVTGRPTRVLVGPRGHRARCRHRP